MNNKGFGAALEDAHDRIVQRYAAYRRRLIPCDSGNKQHHQNPFTADRCCGDHIVAKVHEVFRATGYRA